MTQKIEAIEDNGGMLHLAVLEDGVCWWLSHGREHSAEGALRRDIGSVVADLDQKYAPNQLRTQHAYEKLVDGPAVVIATLEGDKFSHIDPEQMGAAGRRWLGTKRYIAIDANSGKVWGDSAELEGKRFYGSGMDFVQALDRHIDPSAAASREYWDASSREASERGGYHIHLASESYVVPDVGDAGRAVSDACPWIDAVCWSTREV